MSDAFERFSAAVRDAWEESFLAELPTEASERLMSGATETWLEPGEVFYHGAHHAETAGIFLVVGGLVRYLIGAPDGRQVTVRYASAGGVVGLPSALIVGEPERVNVYRWMLMGLGAGSAEALQRSHLVRLPQRAFYEMASTDGRVAWPVARYLALLSVQAQQLLAGFLFLPVRARVASHLLELAMRREGRFVAEASHQEIADAIGSVREVVSRAVRSLQQDGFIERRDKALVLCDPAALHRLASGAER